MAQARRSPQKQAPISSVSSPSAHRKKYPSRRSPPNRKRSTVSPRSPCSTSHAPHASISSPPDLRPVLVPLHPNLRRLPSRLGLFEKENRMRETSTATTQVGVKRKRVTSAHENPHGRPTRGASKYKRLKGESRSRQEYSSDEDEDSTMEIDSTGHWSQSEGSGPEEGTVGSEGAEGTEDPTDDYLLNTASSRQLQRCRKDQLIHLYQAAGLTENAESLTKTELAEAIVAARDDLASLPPSSPLGRGDGNSSGYSSEEGNMAGDEETDFGGPTFRTTIGSSPLKRRATLNDVTKTNARALKGRSMSMGHLLHNDPAPVKKKGTSQLSGERSSRRRVSNRSSPTESNTPSTISQSPPATRLRSRKTSASTKPLTPVSAGSSVGHPHRGNSRKIKGKVKQVEFSRDLTEVKMNGKRGARGREQYEDKQKSEGEESDLTELEVLEESLSVPRAEPSPRRLRSKDRTRGKGSPQSVAGITDARRRADYNTIENTEASRRATPMRRAKARIKSLKETDEDDEEELEVEEEITGVEEEESLDGDEAERNEVDELVSSAPETPPRQTQQTPLRRRLRPRGGQKVILPSSRDNGDISQSDNDQEAADDGDVDGEGEDEEDEVGEEMEAEDEDEEDEVDEGVDETVILEPRKLRNGKVVGDDDVVMDDGAMEDKDEAVEEDEVIEEEDEEDEEDDRSEAGEEDIENSEDEDEPMEEEVDLTIATAKTLVRLRRDDLVRLCEIRDLEPVGTKPQLAEALLQWRDRQMNESSGPSSIGTIRPPSTVRRGKRRGTQHSSESATPPLLMRQHVHQDEPRTPPPSHKPKEAEPELELDLESLGLEDREIPPDKLQKLEKIGSGGFKDVFVGKFRGRKIAISEFRGQLSAMDIKELKLLGGFNHPNIVRFLGVSIPENTRETPVMIVSELCSNGDLFDYVRNVNPPSLHKVLQMMLDIARGLEYLHLRKPSVIHRDCKSSNILITSRGVAKIADFGLAKVKQSTRSMVRSLVGTVNWQAPELWHPHPKYNHKVDVFSCAMVFWEMLQWHVATKKFPWEGMNEHAIYEAVGTKRQRPPTHGLRRQWCPEIVDLIEHMWQQEHQDRPTMSEVVAVLEDIVKRR
ncbi:hypothetical protein AX16_008806 [Volvariella volvacea WC 439]|nr:hypothetical protein AX16_008806 [Volvariella volvacea WC 439]